MKRSIIIGVLTLSLMSVTQAVASITIDFESFPAGPFASYTEQDVTFSASGGGGAIITFLTPNGTLGLVDENIPRKELRADIGPGATFVSVDLGDHDADSDRLFLEIFDIGNNLLGYTDQVISEDFIGMETLSLSAPNIAYAIFGARDAVNGSSVAADNFTFEPIPAPGAILLGSIGVGVVSWLRRRRTL
jgi:hypothetical protein